jgi:putative intracellular protease/amidase
VRHLACFATPLLVGSLFAFSALAAGTPAEAPAKHYVCPPCGLPCDEVVFDAPGTCPKCGMVLVKQQAADAARAAQKKVAILIFTGVEIIDYSGPYEVFGAAGFDVYTVAETKDPIVTAMGMTVVPKFSFADAPQPDVLVVPGGGVRTARGSAPTLKWVADVTGRAQQTMSVCNGAFILASAGLLDGLTATTTAGNLERLKAEYPKTKVVVDQRFVDNGKIITTAGLTAGIDGALHVVSKLLGNGSAQQVALSEEYDWRPKGGFARAALADRLIPDIEVHGIGTWEVVRTEGGTDRWEKALRGTSDLGAAEILDRVGRELAANGKWTMAAAAEKGTSSRASSDWKFSGRDGEPWTARLTIQAVPGEAHRYDSLLTIQRR